MSFDFGAAAKGFLGDVAPLFNICGFIRNDGLVHPLDTDSKVLAAVFEMTVKDRLRALAEAHGFTLESPPEQNYYPDFTLTRKNGDGTLTRLAVDVKSTHGDLARDVFKFTLGSYTGCIHPARETKNIHYPFSTYSEHWVIGFIYQRTAHGHAVQSLHPADRLADVPLPIKNVHHFVQEKWRIAGDKPGSGNTSNIGSIEGSLHVFEKGNGIFSSEAEFLAYWRNYSSSGDKRYTNLAGFRDWCRKAEPSGIPQEVIVHARQAPHQLGLF